jgi:hypothetical protein
MLNATYCSLLILILLPNSTFSQNLVPNPSFEDSITCPSGGNAINLATGWSSYSHTPDYFHSCNNLFVSTPENFAGYQIPDNGSAYVGIINYFIPSSNLREYIGIQLYQPLNIGKTYYVSFKVSMAYNMDSQRIAIATNNMGVRFTTVSFSATNPVPIDNFCHINYQSIISDTINWTEIYGSFVADSAYEFLIIGNFFNDSLTLINLYDSIALYSYYYVDNIQLSSDSNFASNINGMDNNFLPIIYPNPAKDWISINDSKARIVGIIDLFGNKIDIEKYRINELNQFDISFLNQGVYLFTIESRNKSYTKRIIIQ